MYQRWPRSGRATGELGLEVRVPRVGAPPPRPWPRSARSVSSLLVVDQGEQDDRGEQHVDLRAHPHVAGQDRTAGPVRRRSRPTRPASSSPARRADERPGEEEATDDEEDGDREVAALEHVQQRGHALEARRSTTGPTRGRAGRGAIARPRSQSRAAARAVTAGLDAPVSRRHPWAGQPTRARGPVCDDRPARRRRCQTVTGEFHHCYSAAALLIQRRIPVRGVVTKLLVFLGAFLSSSRHWRCSMRPTRSSAPRWTSTRSPA